MKLVSTYTGTQEIESPMFRGSITLRAAAELAARLRQLIEEAESMNPDQLRLF